MPNHILAPAVGFTRYDRLPASPSRAEPYPTEPLPTFPYRTIPNRTLLLEPLPSSAVSHAALAAPCSSNRASLNRPNRGK